MWADPDVRKLQEREQRLYLLLLTHDLTFAGVADWRPARLAGFAADSTAESIREAAHGLARASFVVIDEGTEEIMLRSFLRHDGLLRQPKISVSMANAYAATSSATIRGVLVHELLRLSVEYPEWVAWTLPQVQKILGHDAIDPKTLPVPDGPGLEDGLPIGLGSALPIGLPIGLGVHLPSAKGSTKGLPTPAPTPDPNNLLHSENQAPDEIEPKRPSGAISKSKPAGSDAVDIRPDVQAVIDCMSECLTANDVRFKVGKGWHESARLLIDRDKYTVQQITWLIRWATADSFWKANILSLPKFRAQFEQLKIKSKSQYEAGKPETYVPSYWAAVDAIG
ncbi:hypothetical protein QO003_000042 [Arthrobacter silviterrae]|uniref:Uncharacterized protein n=1 Tax=Arthrobacter silviterrae TaxID=2026658 RepID=A0ABX0DFN5_9MICC|nr:hypothetical protein [Arthrobacter silviterrae]MDQ0275739.1 hypothetical protein [Arthrobacter silviterrae]NGN83163.1 hypothetical protein [Arthrobacter silviterrae]